MKRRKSSSGTIYKIIIVVLSVAFVFSTVQYFVKKEKLLEQKSALLDAIAEQESLSVLYNEELEKIGTPEYYEYMARKNLGYIYPDEKILIVTENNTTQQEQTGE